MRSDIPSKKSSPQSWEGQNVQPSDEKELREAINRAFDYRGDVTIQLKTGDQLIGYAFDRHDDGPQRSLKLFLPDQKEPHIVSYQDIAGVMFSGEDTAFGRSWEDWAQKWKKADSHS